MKALGTHTRPVVALTALATAALLAGCGSSGSSTGSAASSAATSSGSGVTGTITVFAAASLKDSFTTLGKQFESANPGAKVTFNFAGSSALATSITQGNPADVFASASTTNMDSVVKAGGASSATTFAKNVLQIAVPTANPAGVAALADLAKPNVKVARCADEVPCGVLAIKVFQNAGISVTPVDRPADVNGVVKDVTTNEVDAGLVYVTDVLANISTMKGIDIPSNVNASTSYPIAALTKAPNPTGAKAFTDYVLSSAGVSVLTAAGFAKP